MVLRSRGMKGKPANMMDHDRHPTRRFSIGAWTRGTALVAFRAPPATGLEAISFARDDGEERQRERCRWPPAHSRCRCLMIQGNSVGLILKIVRGVEGHWSVVPPSLRCRSSTLISSSHDGGDGADLRAQQALMRFAGCVAFPGGGGRIHSTLGRRRHTGSQPAKTRK